MNKIKFFTKNKRATTLPEILLACVIMACAFLPIIGIMSSSMKATTQDENTQKAVQFCQEKLNLALQMPFNTFDKELGKDFNGIKKSNQIDLNLSSQTINGVTYTFKLRVDNESITYHVPTCNFNSKGKEPKKPSLWDWSKNPITYTINGKVRRYTMTVSWRDVGRNNNIPEKNYTLSTLKADIRTN